MSNKKDDIIQGIIVVAMMITVVLAFFYLLVGCTAGRDACYLCVGPSLDIELWKSKKDSKADKSEPEKVKE